MLLIELTAKMINNNNKVFSHPKKFPSGEEYAQSFTTATETNTKFNSIKVYVCYKIKPLSLTKNILRNNDSNKTFLSLLRSTYMWMK